MNDLVTVGNLLEIADLGSTGFAVNVSVKVCQMLIISKASYRLRWRVVSVKIKGPEIYFDENYITKLTAYFTSFK